MQVWKGISSLCNHAFLDKYIASMAMVRLMPKEMIHTGSKKKKNQFQIR